MPRLSLFACLSLLIAWPLPLLAQAAESPGEQGVLSVTVVLKGLQHPWSMAFLPAQQGLLITERPGRLRLLDAQGMLSAPLSGVPSVYGQGQGGLFDVVLSPDFAQDRWVYLAYAEAGEDGQAGTAVGGGRLVFDGNGYLFITLGDNNQRPTAQNLDKLQGKVVRLHADGRVPADNPFVGQAGARQEIWSYGHRNHQGAALNPRTGQLWTHEHGPRGGDEINIPLAGKNYGWPLATHGVNYSLLAIPEAKGKTVEGTEPPHHMWAKARTGISTY